MPTLSQQNLSADAPRFQQALLDWYRVNRRKLPWRETPSLYKTVVSEFMCQQTQIKTVLPYFARWLDALPDFFALAAAPESQVLKLWEGLGYYSRARNLQRLAQALVALPAEPRTAEAWQELPGVGPYTAAAITSISFGTPVACVDGNVVRILTRLTADHTAFRDSATASRALAPLANAVINRAQPGDHNQAMMELGATVCHRQSPLCTICPVRAFCAAARRGDPETFPNLAAKKIERIATTRVWCWHEEKLLLHRAAAGSRRLAELCELPLAEHLGLDETALKKLPVVAVRSRGITRYAITETICSLKASASQRKACEKSAELTWVSRAELHELTLSGPHRRWINELLAKDSPG